MGTASSLASGLTCTTRSGFQSAALKAEGGDPSRANIYQSEFAPELRLLHAAASHVTAWLHGSSPQSANFLLCGPMATLGAITQLPKDFFLHAVTLAGAATGAPLSPEQAESAAAQLELADASADSALTAERYDYS